MEDQRTYTRAGESRASVVSWRSECGRFQEGRVIMENRSQGSLWCGLCEKEECHSWHWRVPSRSQMVYLMFLIYAFCSVERLTLYSPTTVEHNILYKQRLETTRAPRLGTLGKVLIWMFSKDFLGFHFCSVRRKFVFSSDVWILSLPYTQEQLDAFSCLCFPLNEPEIVQLFSRLWRLLAALENS